MFDHGCDALTTFIFTLSLSTIIALGKHVLILDEPLYYSLMWLMACGAFFFTTLEEYFTEIMYFPLLHGVSEGTVCACVGMMFASFNGGEWYNTTLVDLYFVQLRLNRFITILSFVTSNFFSVMSIHKIYNRFKDRLFEALYYTFCFLMIVSSLIIVQLCYRENEAAYLANSKVLIYVYGFAFAKLVVTASLI
jgi:ethanolaminephosphotransferase